MRAPMLITLVFVAGCFSYHPLAQTAPAPGTKVVATLTGQGSVEMAHQVGPEIASLKGQVVESRDSVLILSLVSVTGRNEQETFWKGERVRVPLAAVDRLEQRRFALGRSLLWGGAAVGALVVAGAAFEGSGASGGGTGGGGAPTPQ